MDLLSFLGNKTPKPDINWVTFPDFGWRQVKNEAGLLQWVSPDNASILSSTFSDVRPDISGVEDIQALFERKRRDLSVYSGGIIRLEVIAINNIPAIEEIVKFPRKPFGVYYIGSLVIPFRDCCFTIRIQSVESGMTGLRDSKILNVSMASGQVVATENGLRGWMKDPYDDTVKDGLLMNLSESEEYDLQFPSHPLSKVRDKLKTIKEDLQFDKGIFDLPAF